MMTPNCCRKAEEEGQHVRPSRVEARARAREGGRTSIQSRKPALRMTAISICIKRVIEEEERRQEGQ